MPLSRRRRRDPVPQKTSNAIVAAASRLNPTAAGFGQRQNIVRQAWQQEAWRQYEISGELKFASTWMANSLSRCRLIVAEVDDKGKIVKETDDAQILGMFGGLIQNPGQQAELLSDLAVQLFVPGDCYVIGEPDGEGSFSRWYVVSIDEISTAGLDRVMIDRGDGLPYWLDTNTNLVVRTYHPYARKHWEADSPVRSALPTLREIEEYGRYINAVINSRLAGAGILGMPAEIDFPAPPEALQPGETNFSATLAKAMLTPISDMGDPSAVVPIVIQGPGEHLEKIVWITNPLGQLTDVPANLRADARGALAVALDLPAAVIKGEGTANHWGEWALEEQSIKIHIEPLLTLICSSLTKGFMVPALDAAGLDVKKYVFWYDATDLILRPDRGQDAKDNYDRGTISADALNAETGFTELDKPTGDEKALRDILKLVSLSPTAADALLPAIARLMGLEKYGVDIAALENLANPAVDPGGTPPQESAPDPNPSARDLPTQKPRQTPNAPTARPAPAVVASLAVHNALSRAGAMLAGRKADLKDVPRHEVHVALGGVSPEDAARVLVGQFEYLESVTDQDTATEAYDRAYTLLTEGRAL